MTELQTRIAAAEASATAATETATGAAAAATAPVVDCQARLTVLEAGAAAAAEELPRRLDAVVAALQEAQAMEVDQLAADVQGRATAAAEAAADRAMAGQLEPGALVRRSRLALATQLGPTQAGEIAALEAAALSGQEMQVAEIGRQIGRALASVG